MNTYTRMAAAELIGTAVLMLIGPGSAILAADVIGPLGVSLAFGFALLSMAYVIGPVSGCHINPAVTLGFLVTKKVTLVQAAYYWVVGAAIGGLLLYVITESGDIDKTKGIFAALLVFVVLSTTRRDFPAGFGGLAAGLTLGMIHLATIPVDDTSVNPARSIGTAFFSGSDALGQPWAFILWPLVGGVVGVGIWKVVHSTPEETAPSPQAA